MTAHAWMQRCAGVQNVSRPMVMCQEMSQCKPTIAQVAAAATVHAYQGTDSATAAVRAVCTAAGLGTAMLFAIFTPEICSREYRDCSAAAVVLLPSSRLRLACFHALLTGFRWCNIGRLLTLPWVRTTDCIRPDANLYPCPGCTCCFSPTSASCSRCVDPLARGVAGKCPTSASSRMLPYCALVRKSSRPASGARSPVLPNVLVKLIAKAVSSFPDSSILILIPPSSHRAWLTSSSASRAQPMKKLRHGEVESAPAWTRFAAPRAPN